MNLKLDKSASRSLEEIINAVKAATGAGGAVIINRPDDAFIEVAVADDSHPDGGYMSSYPLMPNQAYLLVTVEVEPDAVRRGLTAVDGEGVYHAAD